VESVTLASSAAVPGAATLADSQRAGRSRVARALLDHGASTASELAGRLEVTPAAVRRHLDTLVADGLADSRDRVRLGPRGRGRPAREFLLTEAGRDAFHQAYDDLAAGALRYLERVAGPQAVEDFARERLAGLGDRVRPAVRPGPAAEQVEDLAEALSDAGYAATARDAGTGGVQLCQHHCPVAHVAEEFPQLCDAETALFAELLGTHVQRLATIAHGDGVCTTHIPLSAAGHRPGDNGATSVPTTRRTSP
jgi:predicted ArsR family transcriptional regulator